MTEIVYLSNEFPDGSVEFYREENGHMYRVVIKDEQIIYYGPSPWTSHEFLTGRAIKNKL